MVDHGSNPFKNDDTAKKHDIPPFGYYMFLDVFLIANVRVATKPSGFSAFGPRGLSYFPCWSGRCSKLDSSHLFHLA